MSTADLVLAGLIFLVGLLYSCVGHAGASGYIAALTLMGMTGPELKSVPLVLNVLVAIIATVQFRRAGHFSWSLFWPFAVTSTPMAYLGRMVPVPDVVYQPLIGAVLLFSAWRIVAASLRPTEREVRPPALGVALVAGAVLGFVAGMTSTGGGIFLSPLMLLMGWAEPRKVSAVAAPFILVNSIAGILGLFSMRALHWPSALPYWCIAAVVGGVIGAYLGSRKFDTRTIRRVLAAVLIIAGGKLLWLSIAPYVVHK